MDNKYIYILCTSFIVRSRHNISSNKTIPSFKYAKVFNISFPSPVHLQRCRGKNISVLCRLWPAIIRSLLCTSNYQVQLIGFMELLFYAKNVKAFIKLHKKGLHFLIISIKTFLNTYLLQYISFYFSISSILI